MASVLIAKPGTRATAVLGGGVSAIGTAATTTGFYIKLRQITQSFTTQMVEVTGDGDSDPVYDNDEQLDVRFTIRGWMINSQALGLKNLAHTGTVGSGQQFGDMVVNLSNNRTVTYTSIAVRSVDIRLDLQGPFVQVVIQGVGQDTAQGAWE